MHHKNLTNCTIVIAANLTFTVIGMKTSVLSIELGAVITRLFLFHFITIGLTVGFAEREREMNVQPAP